MKVNKQIIANIIVLIVIIPLIAIGIIEALKGFIIQPLVCCWVLIFINVVILDRIEKLLESKEDGENDN